MLSPAQIQQQGASVWGHLPESVRESLRTVTGEGWVQGFEEVSSRYFSELSESD